MQNDPACLRCKDAPMDPQQEAIRRFINELLRATGWAASRMATEAHVSHTTLTRFLNDDAWPYTPSSRTLDKIREAAATVIPEEQIDNLWLLSRRRPVETPARRRTRRLP